MGLLGSSPLNLTVNSKKDKSNKIGSYAVIDSPFINSLFENNKMAVYPTGVNSSTGFASSAIGVDPTSIHTDTIYDTSIPHLIDYTSSLPSMRLIAADFAYLKNLGVYPNNRIMIARRFSNGVQNDLTAVKSTPMSTLISWVPDDNDFIDISFGEEWDNAEASFTDVLNDIGKETLVGDNKGGMLGNMAAAGAGALPLPGFMEGLQYEVMKKMGITNTTATNLPGGNPNLIRQAKKRKTIDKNTAGSGLKCDFSIKMVVEYEQKFINGVDPTFVYFDIIANILTFGTSDSQFQFNNSFAVGEKNIMKDLMSGDILAIGRALAGFVGSLIAAIKDVGLSLLNSIINPPKKDKADPNSVFSGISGNAFAVTIGAVIGKYRIRLLGVVSSLTGNASAPWHITIGNPQRPLFSSGDMLIETVDLKLGKTLAFNGLPSSIRAEFTMKPARNLGAQEIFNRFNTGKGRSYQRLQGSYVEVNTGTFSIAQINNAVGYYGVTGSVDNTPPQTNFVATTPPQGSGFGNPPVNNFIKNK